VLINDYTAGIPEPTWRLAPRLLIILAPPSLGLRLENYLPKNIIPKRRRSRSSSSTPYRDERISKKPRPTTSTQRRGERAEIIRVYDTLVIRPYSAYIF
jgi:hypothetical protein